MVAQFASRRSFLSYAAFLQILIKSFLLLPSSPHFAAPPLIATATSLVATVRAIGGGVGSAVMGGQVNSRMAKNLGPRMAPVALANGITQATLPAAIAAFRSACVLIPFSLMVHWLISCLAPVAIARLGLTPAQIAAILPVVRSTYASAFRWAWVTLIPPTALGLVAILLLDQSKNRERMVYLAWLILDCIAYLFLLDQTHRRNSREGTGY